MNDKREDSLPWLNRLPPYPWTPPPEWAGTPFAIRRVFFELNGKTHGNDKCACPACGYPTLPHRANGGYCPLCFWEDDRQDDPWADYENSGPNPGTLNEARRSFAVTLCMLSLDDSDVPDSTVQLILSKVWRERQRALCDAYDRLMELSDPKDIAQQWGVIELLWKRGSSGLDDRANDNLPPL